MDKEFRELLIEKVGKKLNDNNFYLADWANKYFVYHRSGDSTVEIIQIGQDKYETYVTVSASIVFLNTEKEHTNINYPMFDEFNNGNIEKISVDDCHERYYLKGNFGNGFHYGNVYLALGRGIVGVAPNSKKPIGIRIKRYKSTTYNEICDLIIKRLRKAYCWLERKQSSK